MEQQQLNVILTGTEGPVTGIVNQITDRSGGTVYRFDSVDDTLYLIISQDETGHWKRIDGSEPYLSGWVDELAEQITKLHA